MDEVIADPMRKMIDWYRSEYNGPINYDDMVGTSWIDGFPIEHRKMVRAQLNEPGFFRDLPVIGNSVDVLRRLNEKYELYIVSAATEFPNSLKDKYEWLQDHFPFLTWHQIVFCGDKKMIRADFMIDDHARHLKHFIGEAYIFDAAHNGNETEYERIMDWDDAAKKLL